MLARSIYISSSPAETEFRDALAAALHRADAHAVFSEIDRPMTQSRPLDEALLRRCDGCVVVLTGAALGAPRMLHEAKRYAELAQREPERALIVVLLEPIAANDIWPFLLDAPRVEGPDGAEWVADVLLFGVLHALGLTYTIPHAAPPTSPLVGRRATLPPSYELSPSRTTLPPALPRTNRQTVPIDWASLQLVEDPWAAVAEPLVTASLSLAPRRRRSRGYDPSRQYLPLVVALSLVMVLALSGLVLLRQGVGPFSIGAAPTGSHVATATHAPAARPTATSVPPTHAPDPTATPQPAATATPLPTNWAQFVKTDATTQGSWMGVYGAQGAAVFEDGSTLPTTIAVTPNGDARCSSGCWAGQTDDPRGLEKVSDPTNTKDRIAACWYTPSTDAGASYTIDVNITDGQTHRMALYLLDWDGWPGGGRGESISLADGSTSAAGGTSAAQFDTQAVSQFQGGVYLVWKVRGHVRITVTNSRAGSNAVASGLFFDAA